MPRRAGAGKRHGSRVARLEKGGLIAQPGLLIYIMVDSVAATVDVVVAAGGVIVQPLGVDAPEITARFRDPGGNVLGLYQQTDR